MPPRIRVFGMVANVTHGDSGAPPRSPAAGVLRAAPRALRWIGAAARFLAPVFALLLLWEISTRIGLVDARILPPPSAIAARAAQLLSPAADRVLLEHVTASILRAVGAFVIAAAIAVPLGFWLGLSPGAYAWVGPIFSVLLPLPAVAWAPVFLVAFGQGTMTILTLCVLGAVFPILYSTIQGVRAIDRQSVWVLRSMGADGVQIFFRVLVPASLPPLITGCRLGLAHSWRTLVAAEMLAALDYGLGYMIFAAREYMDTATMFVGVVFLAALGFAFEHMVFGAIEAHTLRRWYASRGIASGA